MPHTPYIVRKAKKKPELKGLWNGPAWSGANVLDVASFRVESSDHHPRTQVKLLYDHERIYGCFRVEDRYVRVVRTQYQDITSRDSCVEVFLKPKRDKGYFALEFNAGGTLLFYYITDSTRTPDAFKEYVKIPTEEWRLLEVYHSLPAKVEPEIQEPVEWLLEFSMPLSLMEKYAGPLGVLPGQEWTANSFKCGDETSHPHWASWMPVDHLNFHMPRCFGNITFEP
ncbi:MAG: carbohydrate-binding family 9-like protein [Verrucomicrobiae bacterium]|nr:carbohydrate-binding family 9-like protein [Verrucomicrobiae bacterium]